MEQPDILEPDTAPVPIIPAWAPPTPSADAGSADEGIVLIKAGHASLSDEGPEADPLDEQWRNAGPLGSDDAPADAPVRKSRLRLRRRSSR